MIPRTIIIPLSMGKGTWREAIHIARQAERAVILTAAYAADRVASDTRIPGEKHSYNPDQPILTLRDTFITLLRETVEGEIEVGVSLISGSGKEHMALLGALMRIPIAFRLVTLENDTLIEL